MALPRRWERGEGFVPLLTPDLDAVRARHDNRMTHEQYREGFLRLVAFRIRRKGMRPEPGLITANTPLDPVLLADGDTLLCACGAAKAAADRCHRRWAAAFLALAGWRVVLDRAELSPEEARLILRPPEIA